LESARIAILCPGYGVVTRGVEIFVEGMVARLRRVRPGWSFDIFCRGEDAEPSPGVRLIHVPAVDRDGRAARLYAQACHHLGAFLRTRIDAECFCFTLALAPKLLHRRYDLIFNQAGPFAGCLLRAKRRLDGTPFIHKTASGYGDLEVITARQRPDAIIATSPFVKTWLQSACPGSRVECIPNAVDRAQFRPFSPREMEECRNGHAIFSLRRPIVLFVGAMDPMKRPELLISAMSRVPEAGLAMVGSGRLAESLPSLGITGLEGRFLYVPRLPRDQMALYYNACNLFTLPSEEPFGISFLEAMACNKPVLSHHSPVQQWIFGDAGTMCDCTDADEYARAIRRMLESDFGDRPVRRSRAFDWREVSERYADLFSRVMAR
jgi:glycosyltransferase involved in cell wall biosynthesis